MLKEKDKIFKNLYGFQDWSVKGAKFWDSGKGDSLVGEISAVVSIPWFPAEHAINSKVGTKINADR